MSLQFCKKINSKTPTPIIVGGIYKSYLGKVDALFMLCNIDERFVMVVIQGKNVKPGFQNSATFENAEEFIKYYELVAQSLPQLMQTYEIKEVFDET